MRFIFKNSILSLFFLPLFGITSHFDDFGTKSINHLSRIFMAKSSKSNYLTAKNQINKISEEDLKKALTEVNEKNLKVRKSFKLDSDALSLRAGR